MLTTVHSVLAQVVRAMAASLPDLQQLRVSAYTTERPTFYGRHFRRTWVDGSQEEWEQVGKGACMHPPVHSLHYLCM